MDRENSIASALGFSDTDKAEILFLITEKFAGVKTISEHIEKICEKRKLNIEAFWAGFYLYALIFYTTETCEKSQLTGIKQIAEELNISKESQNKIELLAKKSCPFGKISAAIKAFCDEGNFNKRAVLIGFYFIRRLMNAPLPASAGIVIIFPITEYDSTDLTDLRRIAG